MKYRGGHEFEFRGLKPSQIKKDELYQRKTDDRRVDQIVRNFNGDIFNEPKVSYRDGVYWCFNGMHSVSAWVKLHNGEDKPLLCKVYKGMTWLDECEAFMEQNGISKDPTTNEKLKAAKEARRPDVLNMVNGAEAAGFTVSFTLHKKPFQIVATSALFKAYKRLGDVKYADMLRTIRDAWGGDLDGVSAPMLHGLTRFYEMYAGMFKGVELAAKLKSVRPIDIIRNGRDTRGGVTREIVKLYNKKRKVNRLEEVY